MTNSTLRLKESLIGVGESVFGNQIWKFWVNETPSSPKLFECMQYRGWKIYAHYYCHSFHFFFQLLCCLREQQSSLSIACLCLKRNNRIASGACSACQIYICGVIFPGNVVMVQTIKMLMDIFAHCNFLLSSFFELYDWFLLIYAALTRIYMWCHFLFSPKAESYQCCCWFCSIELHSSRLM